MKKEDIRKVNNENISISDWLKEDLHLKDILFDNDHRIIIWSEKNKKNNVLRVGYDDTYTPGGYNAYSDSYGNYSDSSYSDYSDYNDHYYNNQSGVYGEYVDGYYPDYNEYLVTYYSNYANSSGGYDDTYHAAYTAKCRQQCQFQCEVNQFVNDSISTFAYTDEIDYILASHYNDLVDYINTAATFVNSLVTYYNLDSSYSIDISLNNITISDIYRANNFNLINEAINKFIDGITNILAKITSIDYINKNDMITLEEILNQIKIPPTTPLFAAHPHP